ncbi:uncharacterized protein LOC136076551 [Hydra vulgaris]|uniref:Uncharacterized protein LOC136076551 n=1 Tax=Hydra vulgaris TaxID=6087 RepID=A0ABM4BAK9_HYDVU
MVSPVRLSQRQISDSNLKGFSQVPVIDMPPHCSMFSMNPSHVPLSDCNLNGTMDKTLVALLIEMKTSIKELQRQSEINTQLLQTLLDNKYKYDDSMLEEYNLPIDNIKDLDVFDSLIMQDKAIFNKLVIALASKGGQSIREIVKRAINALITNDLQRKFNWTGTVGQAGDKENISTKRAFRKLYCCLALQRGISKNPPTKSITESEFQVEVVLFLRGAADRNGGRKMRAVNKN